MRPASIRLPSGKPGRCCVRACSPATSLFTSDDGCGAVAHFAAVAALRVSCDDGERDVSTSRKSTAPSLADLQALQTRRQLLKTSAVGFGHLALQALLGQESTAAAASTNPLVPRQPHHPPRARRIVFLFMKGGPSHVDTFDPK